MVEIVRDGDSRNGRHQTGAAVHQVDTKVPTVNDGTFPIKHAGAAVSGLKRLVDVAERLEQDIDTMGRHSGENGRWTESDRQALKNVWEFGKVSHERALKDDSDFQGKDPTVLAEILSRNMLEASVRLRNVINGKITDIRVDDITSRRMRASDLDQTKVADVREATLEHPDGGRTVYYFMQLENYRDAREQKLSSNNRKSIEETADGKPGDTETSTLLGQIYIPSRQKHR